MGYEINRSAADGCSEPPKTMRRQKNFSFCDSKLIAVRWDEVFMGQGGALGTAGCRLIEFVVSDRQTYDCWI